MNKTELYLSLSTGEIPLTDVDGNKYLALDMRKWSHLPPETLAEIMYHPSSYRTYGLLINVPENGDFTKKNAYDFPIFFLDQVQLSEQGQAFVQAYGLQPRTIPAKSDAEGNAVDSIWIKVKEWLLSKQDLIKSDWDSTYKELFSFLGELFAEPDMDCFKKWYNLPNSDDGSVMHQIGQLSPDARYDKLSREMSMFILCMADAQQDFLEFFGEVFLEEIDNFFEAIGN